MQLSGNALKTIAEHRAYERGEVGDQSELDRQGVGCARLYRRSIMLVGIMGIRESRKRLILSRKVDNRNVVHWPCAARVVSSNRENHSIWLVGLVTAGPGHVAC